MAALADEVIGRAAERTELGVFADTVASGPAALMLEGEAGAGKTTLWLAGCELARSLGYHVLAARPAAPEARLAFAGLGDLLGGVLDEALDVLPPPQAHALRVALVLEAPGDARLDERVLGVSALSALRALGAARPVLLAVDDVQWLDPASARVLAFAWRRLDDGPGGLLLAHRTGEPVPHQLAGLAPLRRVSVGPLDAGDVHRLLRSRLGLVLPRPTVARVHAVAGGNPFLALEVGRELEAGADFPSVPDRLLELVEDRIAGLPHATREALAATAALALPTLELVAAAGGDEALGPAFAAHVVELDGDRLRFTHPLLAAAASTAIDPVGRRALLRRLAGTVADEDERARLQALVTDGPDREVAGALERAAGRAQGRGASAVAAQLCEQSRDLTPPGATADADRRALQAASYHWTAGDVERARSTLEDASRQASTPVARAEALTELAWVHLFQSDEPHGAALARRALEELGPHAPARPHALNCLSTAHQLMLEDLEEAARLSDEAVAFARRSGDANGLSENLCGVAYAAALRGHPRTESALAEAEALGPRAWGWRAVGWPSSHRAAADWWADRTEASVAASRRIEAQALHRGDAGSIPTILAYRAPVEYAAGRWPEADATATEGIEAAAQAGEPLNQALALAARALVRASTGRSDDARADAEGALAIAGDRSAGLARIHAQRALALLELARDRPEAAASRLTPLRARLLAAGVGEPGVIAFVADEIEALVACGRLAAAERVLGWLERRGRVLDRPSARAGAERGRGLLAAAGGDRDTATAAFGRALAQHARVTMPFEHARTLLHLGTVQRQAMRKREARATLAEAQRRFDALGAAPWSTRTEGELARISGRRPRGAELTASERRIAELVAEGRTNKEVAAALFLSPRTVEAYLRQVFLKLRVRSRTELARHPLDGPAGGEAQPPKVPRFHRIGPPDR